MDIIVVFVAVLEAFCTVSFAQDFAKPCWVTRADMLEGGYGFSSISYNGKIYVFGGSAEVLNGFTDKVQEYDPLSNTWTMKAKMLRAKKLWCS